MSRMKGQGPREGISRDIEDSKVIKRSENKLGYLGREEIIE